MYKYDETTLEDDVYYVCCLIEFVARETRNHRGDIVKHFTLERMQRQIDMAQVDHCLSFEEVGSELIEELGIKEGTFDTVSECKYNVPSFIAIGRNYSDLIYDTKKDDDVAQCIIDVFSSFISDAISNFNSSMYYENPSYLKACYLAGEVLDW